MTEIIDRVQLKYKDFLFDFYVPYRLNVITGDSATGKSLFANILKSAISVNSEKAKKEEWLSKAIVLNYDSEYIERIRNLTGYLIVIDNFDYLKMENDWLVKYINKDMNNKYIIMGRDIADLRIEYKQCSDIVRNGNTLSLEPWKF